MQPRRIIIFLTVLFVLFLIWQAPTATGDGAGAYFAWIGDLFTAAIDFLDSVFDGSNPPAPEAPQST
jgi:hypothetical protein